MEAMDVIAEQAEHADNLIASVERDSHPSPTGTSAGGDPVLETLASIVSGHDGTPCTNDLAGQSHLRRPFIVRVQPLVILDIEGK